MNRPVHFELHVKDVARARKFYEETFGWRFSEFEGTGYWLATTGAAGQGINGGIMQSKDGNPRTINTIEVPNVDDYTERVTEAGGTLCLPKMAIKGVGWLVYFTDPDGILFGIYHPDTNAK